MSMLRYPILIRASEHCTDKYLQQVFEDLATGRSPLNGLVCNGSCVVCTIPKRHFVYTISEDTAPPQVAAELGALLIKSFPEELVREEWITDPAPAVVTGSWHELRKKNIKDMLLFRFVEKLGVADSARAVEQLRTLLVLKLVTPKDVYMDPVTGDIERIDNIEVQDGAVVPVLAQSGDTYRLTQTAGSAGDDATGQDPGVGVCVAGWSDYLSDLRKARVRT